MLCRTAMRSVYCNEAADSQDNWYLLGSCCNGKLYFKAYKGNFSRLVSDFALASRFTYILYIYVLLTISFFPLFSKTVALVNKVAIMKKVVQSRNYSEFGSLLLISKNCKQSVKTLSKDAL